MWKAIIGIETLAAILSSRKAFSGTLIEATRLNYDDLTPNSLLRGLDVGLPGTLPVLDPTCVHRAIAAALALNSQIQPRSTFDRKHYAYLDLPAGYQITQKYHPVALSGHVLIRTGLAPHIPAQSTPVQSNPNTSSTSTQSLHSTSTSSTSSTSCTSSDSNSATTTPSSRSLADGYFEKIIGIERIQIEHDSGKSHHDRHPLLSFVDYNRAGVGLLEIVSMPHIHSAQEAAAYVLKVQQLLQRVAASEALLELGSMRCDVNVSVVRSDDPDPLSGVRCEIKNINSTKYLAKAVEFEVQRQTAILEAGGKVRSETRGFDASTGETFLQRSKESEVDYRYMPDPDLPPLLIPAQLVDRVRSGLPEHLDDVHARLARHGLTYYELDILLQHPGAPDFFTRCLAHFSQKGGGERGAEAQLQFAKKLALWMVGDLLGQMAKKSVDGFRALPTTPEQFVSLLQLIDQEEITARAAKQLLGLLVAGSASTVEALADELNLRVLRLDDEKLKGMCQAILDGHPREVEEYRAGRTRKMKFFVGEIMTQTKGRANPQQITQMFEKLIG